MCKNSSCFSCANCCKWMMQVRVVWCLMGRRADVWSCRRGWANWAAKDMCLSAVVGQHVMPYQLLDSRRALHAERLYEIKSNRLAFIPYSCRPFYKPSATIVQWFDLYGRDIYFLIIKQMLHLGVQNKYFIMNESVFLNIIYRNIELHCMALRFFLITYSWSTFEMSLKPAI